MNYIYYAHRYADAIIVSDSVLKCRYNEFVETLAELRIKN